MKVFKATQSGFESVCDGVCDGVCLHACCIHQDSTGTGLLHCQIHVTGHSVLKSTASTCWMAT